MTVDLEAIEAATAMLVPPLKAALVTLPNLGDAKSANERADIASRRFEMSSTISGLQNHDLDKPVRQLAECEIEVAAVAAEQKRLQTELAAVPETFTTSTERDRLHDARTHLQRQLKMLDDGTLLRGPGVTFPRVIDVEARSAELKIKIDRLLQRHAAFVAQAEALLSVAK